MRFCVSLRYFPQASQPRIFSTLKDNLDRGLETLPVSMEPSSKAVRDAGFTKVEKWFLEKQGNDSCSLHGGSALDNLVTIKIGFPGFVPHTQPNTCIYKHSYCHEDQTDTLPTVQVGIMRPIMTK